MSNVQNPSEAEGPDPPKFFERLEAAGPWVLGAIICALVLAHLVQFFYPCAKTRMAFELELDDWTEVESISCSQDANGCCCESVNRDGEAYAQFCDGDEKIGSANMSVESCGPEMF